MNAILFFILIFFFFFLWETISNFREYRLISGTPVVPVDSIDKEGFVGIEGQIVPIYTIETPFTANECVYYSSRVEWSNSNDEGGSLKHENVNDFFVSGQKEKILISPSSKTKILGPVEQRYTSNAPILNKSGKRDDSEYFEKRITSFITKIKGEFTKPTGSFFMTWEKFIPVAGGLLIIGYAKKLPNHRDAKFIIEKVKGYPFIINTVNKKDSVIALLVISVIFAVLCLACLITFCVLIFKWVK